MLIYPDVDFRRSNFSIQEFAGEDEKLDPQVSPLLAPRLEGLPPAFIVTAGYDALRDEGEKYGARLQEAGVPTTVKRYDGMIHEFIRWPFDDAERALDDIAAALADAFAAEVRS